MPKIVPIAQIADAFPSPTVLPKRPPLQRKLELMQLIEALLAKRPDLAPRSSVAALADSLSVLFDEIQADGIPADRVTRLDVADASEHWQSSLEFLKIASNYLAQREDGLSDGEERQRSAVLALVERWKSQMPQSPVIVAGSTGSRATTLSLMEAVLKLPQGAVVLPGFDFDQPEHAWEALGKGASNEDHPQARFKKLFSLVEIPPKAVKAWTGVVPNQRRNRLVSLALRPAPVTNAWMREGPALGDLFEATAEMDLIEAPSPIVEAHANALRIRQALADDQTVALITPNRTLARQVTAALGRWGVEPDDSAGVPLSLSPPGRLLIQLASLNGQSISASDLIVLLKHPLTASKRKCAASIFCSLGNSNCGCAERHA